MENPPLPAPCLPLRCTHLLFIHRFAFVVFLLLMGVSGPPRTPSCPTSQLSSCSIAVRLSVLGCSGGSRRDTGNRPRTKLASEALWGPDAAPVLSAQSVLVCPRLRESHTAACEELSSPFLPVLPSCTELLLFALDPASWFSWQGPSRQRTRAEDSAEGRAELQRAQVPSAPLKCVPLQRTRLRSAAPGAPAGSGWGCTDSEAGSSSSAWLWSSKAGK